LPTSSAPTAAATRHGSLRRNAKRPTACDRSGDS
jgi:hypothetical protein